MAVTNKYISRSMFADSIGIEGIAFSLLVPQVFTADVEIRLGYTTKEVSGMSLPLDDNVTSPLTTVFVDHNFSQLVTSGSESFGLQFLLPSTPFMYDPASGQNLLLDLIIGGKSAPPGIIEQGASMVPSVPTTLTGRAYDMTGFTGVNPWGARTEFIFESQSQSVPEPMSFVTWTLIFALATFDRYHRGQSR